MNESERKAAFRANGVLSDFLAALLQDAEQREADEACSEGREARDSGTIYDCPDSTFRASLAICDAFRDSVLKAATGGALASLDLDCPYTLDQMGSDLYLESAGHGAGFRDRDSWSDDRDECRAIGEALSGLVPKRSHLETYFGDNGRVYIVGGETS